MIAAAVAAAWILTQKKALAPVLNPPATKDDLIRVDTPRPNQTIQSPLVITGEARGNWFFEASFPVVLVNWDGLIIAQGIATAKSDWMTSEFVPFQATLNFTIDKNTYSNRGALILKKDNPSGLPANDNSIEVPIIFDGIKAPPTACTQEAKQCPDGSYVGRSGPNCEFSVCSEENNDIWKTATSNGITFQYPKTLFTEYIHTVDWPPQVQVLNELFICTEAGTETARAGQTVKRMVDDRTYCVTKESEGAAGSIYTNYAYAFPKDGKTIILAFSLRAVQCANYDNPQKTACENERSAFDLDSTVDRMARSITQQ